MNRRDVLRTLGLGAAATLLPASAAAAATPAPTPRAASGAKLKITGVRVVRTRPKRPVPAYQPAPGSWSIAGVEVANPMSIYPK